MPTSGWIGICENCGKETMEMESRGFSTNHGECLSCGYFIENGWDYFQKRNVKRVGILHKLSGFEDKWIIVNHWYECPARFSYEMIDFIDYHENWLMKNPDKLDLTNSLHLAVKKGELVTVRNILESGNEPADSKDICHELTLMHAAALSGNVAMAKLLQEFGVKLDVPDDEGTTPLHLAAELNYVRMAIWFLNNNAPVNISDKDGDTPLHYALYQNHRSSILGDSHADIISLLIDSGADCDLKNKKSISVKDIFELWSNPPAGEKDDSPSESSIDQKNDETCNVKKINNSENEIDPRGKDTPIEDLCLPIRTFNCLRMAGFKILGDLVEIPKEDFMRIRNFSDLSYEEVQKTLHAYGLIDDSKSNSSEQ